MIECSALSPCSHLRAVLIFMEGKEPSVAEGSASESPIVARPPWKSALLVATCTFAMITNLASTGAISIFLPVIGEDLNIPEDKLQWLVSACSLSSGCFLLLFGRLADLFGRKKFFLLGIIWLSIFCIGCGFAQNATTLYILRGFQGLGPAAFLPACLGILAHGFPESRARSIAFATFSAGAHRRGAWNANRRSTCARYSVKSLRSSCFHVSRNRVFFASTTWRSPFYLFAGMSALCAVGGLFAIDADLPSTEPDRRVDWFGAFLVTAGLILLIFVLGQGQLASHGWRTPYIIALLIVSVLTVKGDSAPPLMKLSLWTRANGRFAVIQAIAFLEWSAFLSWYLWSQLYYEDFVKLRPVFAALRMLPMTVAGILCNVLVVLTINRVDFSVLVAFGTLCTAVAALLFAIIHPAAPYWAYGFPSPILAVVGGDFVFAAGTIFVAKISLPHEQSLAGGLFQTLTQLGTAFGLAVSTLAHDGAAGQSRGDQAPLKAYQAAQWTAFGMAMLCTLLAGVFLRGVGPVGLSGPSKVAQLAPEQRDEKLDSKD
ncbi:MFS general substrate transporter [Mycena metata]|uniref:MFS general substrate transporter n=1 Tax=Mycena metata TaxID=1033252 RepID=A0AAD7NUW3_9AGAR|nr:MFS general substrate transporter [Mycena metata]